MLYKKTLTLLVTLIIILATAASLLGIFSSNESGIVDIESFREESVQLYGQGLYSLDSTTIAAQGIAQDIVTLLVGVPLLLWSLILSLRDDLRFKLLLTGTLGYFLYTYTSYVFLWMYNPLFLVYVALMSVSFFALVIAIQSIDRALLKNSFSKNTPHKFLGGFQIFFAFFLAYMWLEKIIHSLINNTIPNGLDHYTTLVIQGLDLGFIVPLALLSGIMLIKRKPFGYLLSSIIITKGFTMGIAITAMVINQLRANVSMPLSEIIMFPAFSVVLIYCMYVLLKNIQHPKNIESHN